MKRLPLPLSTIKELKVLVDLYSNNLWIKNPLKNALNALCAYEYKEAIDILLSISKDDASIMDFKKHIKLINSAQEKYNAI